MKTASAIIFLAFLPLYTACAGSESGDAKDFCPDIVVSKLLTSILAQDEDSIYEIANNTEIFDEVAMRYLVGDAEHRFSVRDDVRSAYAVLHGGRVLTKIVVHEESDGSSSVDAVYLPERTAKSFPELERMVLEGKAEPFVDYVMCKILIQNDVVSMPHACYAETDTFAPN